MQHFLASSSLMKNQSRLADYDTQIASGSRYQTPSGDALNASLTMLTQAVMERKAQYASNLKSANAYLTASDLALGGIGTLSNEARAAGLEAINTATGDAERETLMQGVKSSVQ
ncbi:MAG TPA: hypothetical protein DEB39_05100, partial [Planctomycetaceae bacterium]|nr:hypothetical protein [Planctomycetaceae bacterium]